jgi:Tfp pilus assembly protein PilF
LFSSVAQQIACKVLCCYDAWQPHFDAVLLFGYLMSHRTCFLLSCVLFSAYADVAVAAPYVPNADTQVLERLPFKPNDPIAREMSEMRAELLRNPQNIDVAVRLAKRYYGLVAEEGDPRYLGYAQSALAPWWDMPEPPVEVQVLRAGLGQFRHDFTGAIADLTQVIKRMPGHPQARALRATIYIVQAHYEQARADCQALKTASSALIAIGCEAMIDGLTGKATVAYQTLKTALAAHPEATPDEQLWILIRLAELAQRLEQYPAAEAHFKQALSLNIGDTFLLAAYADFLLDRKRPAEVVALLKEKIRSDTLLLRLVLAERILNVATANDRQITLAARYAAAQLRGDTVHQQEEARFALTIEENPKRALMLAQENWKVQLEPRDARIFLEAALALKDVAAAQPVLQWLDSSHIEDRYLMSLATQLKGARQ